VLSVADRIAQVAVAVIAVWYRCLVWDGTEHQNSLRFLKKPCSYCSENFIMLHSNNMNVAQCKLLYVYKAPWH